MSSYLEANKDRTLGSISNLPNAFVAYQTNSFQPFTELNGRWLPFLQRVLRRHPDWRAILHVHSFPDLATVPKDTSHAVASVHITDENYETRLGTITAQRGGGYSLTSKSIASRLTRGSYTTSKDVNKVLRIIDKDFVAPSTSERITETLDALSNVVYSYANTYEQAYNAAMTAMFNESVITKFLIPNIDQLVAHTPSGGKGNVATFPEAYNNRETARRQQVLISTRAIALLQVDGSSVRAAYRGDDDKFQFKDWATSAAYTEDVRRGLGMLKLVPVKTVLPDIGVRLSDTMFVIFNLEEEKPDGPRT